MERLKLTATADVRSAGAGGGPPPQQYRLYASPLCYVNARHARLSPCRLLGLRQSHACFQSG